MRMKMNVTKMVESVAKFIGTKNISSNSFRNVLSEVYQITTQRNKVTPIPKKEELDKLVSEINVPLKDCTQTLGELGFSYKGISNNALYITGIPTVKQTIRYQLGNYGVTMSDSAYKRTNIDKMKELLVNAKFMNIALKEKEHIHKAVSNSNNFSDQKTDHVLVVDEKEFEILGTHFTKERFFKLLENEPEMYSKKKKQIRVRQSSLDELVWNKDINLFELNEKSKVFQYSTSESRILRQNITCDTIMKNGEQLDILIANDTMIMNCDVEINNPFMITSIIKNGFMYLGKLWKPFLRSASQARSHKFVFTALDPDTARQNVTYGSKFFKEDGLMNPAKTDAYSGNGMSSSIEVGYDYTYKIIKDHVEYVTIPVRTWTGQPNDEIEEEIKTLKLEQTDGQGTVRPVAAARISYRYGLLTKAEYTFFILNFINLDEMYQRQFKNDNTSKKLWKIFNKIPSGFQIRPAGVKGFVVMYEHDKYGSEYDVDICLTESMVKYAPDVVKYPEIYLEVLQTSKPPKMYTKTNYQMLQSLNISAEDIKKLGIQAMAKFDDSKSGVFHNPKSAKKFLGLLSNIGDDEPYEDKLLSKLMITLDTCEDMINTSYVQKSLYRLTYKYLNDISIGKIPIEGQYAYIITDVSCLFTDKSLLNKGEYYYNGIKDKWLITRSPLVHRSETVTVNTVDIPEYWYLKNLLILNPFDDTLPRMGGADTDGDKVCMTRNQILLDSVYTDVLPMLYDSGKKGVQVPATKEELEKFWIKNIVPSAEGNASVGTVTNSATVINDKALHNGDVTLGDALLMQARFIQGWVIDAPKTNTPVQMPENLKDNDIPHWLAFNKLRKGRQLSKKAKVYISKSPMGQLHSMTPNYIKERFTDEGTPIVAPQPLPNTNVLFAHTVNHAEVEQFSAIVKKLEQNYRQELRTISEMQSSHSIKEEEADNLRNSVFERYTALMDSIDCSEMTKGALAYSVSYFDKNADRKKTSNSFVWVTAFKGLIEILQHNYSNKRMFKLPKAYSEDNSIESVVVIENVMYIGDDFTFTIKSDSIPDNIYKVDMIDGVNYITVTLENPADYSDVYRRLNGMNYEESDNKVHQITLTGFSHQGLTADNFIELIKNNNWEIDIIADGKYNSIYINNKRYGTVSSLQTVPVDLINTKVKILNHQDTWLIDQYKIRRQRNAFHVDVQFVSPLNTTLTDRKVDLIYNEDYMGQDLTDFISIDTPMNLVLQPTAPIVITSQKSEPVLDPKVLQLIDTSAWYWDRHSLETPSGIQDYKITVLNTSISPEQDTVSVANILIVGTNGRTYEYNVIYTRIHKLSLTGDTTPKRLSQAWMLRLAAYKAAELKARG